MRYLAIDFGRRRTGVALSDEAGKWAFPHATWEGWSRQRISEEILTTVQVQQVQSIVIGLPLAVDGAPPPMQEPIQKLAEMLRTALAESRLEVTVHFQDERYSTAVVLGQLREAGISQRRARDAGGQASTDARAAAVILQNFLDASGSRV